MLRPTASLFIGLVISLLSTTMGWAEPEPPVVLFEQPSHFTTPDGTDVLVAPGTYRVEQSAETQLRLVADPPQPAIEIQATATTHEETVAAPLALAIAEESQADEIHLVLLFPDGRGLDATGSLSGTRSRGTSRIVAATQLRSSLVQSTGLFSGMASQPSVLYGVAPAGALKWYRHNGAPTGAGLTSPGAWTGPTEVGSGWQDFIQVVPGGGAVLYGIARDGTLKWYRHDDAMNGTPAWQGAKNVGTGWQNFKQVFSGSEGILYAIAQDGTLKWYRHTGYRDGAATWDGPKNVGTGWQNFTTVFGMGDGVIYAIAGDGKLTWYKHVGFRDGTMAWDGPKNVGNGWQNFKQVVGAGQGLIYAIANDGILKWYKHLGYRDGTVAWEGAKDIGTGWQGFSTIVALLPLPPGQDTEDTGIVAMSTMPAELVTWGYLRMHAPQEIVSTLRDVQAGTRSVQVLQGLASPERLSQLLATQYPETLAASSPSLQGVTPRALPSNALAALSQQTVESSSSAVASAMSPTQSASSVNHLSWGDLFTPNTKGTIAKDKIGAAIKVQLLADFSPKQLALGSIWAGQTPRAQARIVASRDGEVTVSLAKTRPFRIVEIRASSGVLRRVATKTASAAVVNPESAQSRTQPPWTLNVKAGQDVLVTVEFAPHFDLFNGDSAGQYLTTLEVYGDQWFALVPVAGFFNGIRIGMVPILDSYQVDIVNPFPFNSTNNCAMQIPQGLTLSNADQQAHTVVVEAAGFPGPFSMAPVTVVVPARATQHVSLPIVLHCLTQTATNSSQFDLNLTIKYDGQQRSTSFALGVYPYMYRWTTDGKIGSCKYSSTFTAEPDGQFRLTVSVSASSVLPRTFDYAMYLLGMPVAQLQLYPDGVFKSGVQKSYGFRQPALAIHYEKLFDQKADVRLRCVSRGLF